MITKPFCKIYKIYRDSYKSLQLFILALSLVIYLILRNRLNPEIIESSYVDVLNGFGVMTAFFILALDKIDVEKIKKKLTDEVKLKKHYSIAMSKKLLNTIFSLMISMFFILCSLYILLIVGVKLLFPLILLCLFIFIGFIFLICIWHWTDSLD